MSRVRLPRKLKKDTKRWLAGHSRPSPRLRHWARRASALLNQSARAIQLLDDNGYPLDGN